MPRTTAFRGVASFAAFAHRRAASVLVLASLAPFAVACGGSDPPGIDGAVDASGDDSTAPHGDGGGDADATTPRADGGVDASADATNDATLDAETDADRDGASDARVDAPSDARDDADGAPRDAASDAESDAHADAASDADTGTPTCVPDPANYDIPGNGCDDDGDGTIDNLVTCDLGLAANGSAEAFANAIGLCRTASLSDTKWGVVSATFTNGHSTSTLPNAAQHGILPKFGNTIIPREGTMLGVLSTGTATEQDGDDGPFFKGSKTGMQGSTGPGNSGDAPPGFPKTTPGCPAPITSLPSDLIDLKLQIRVPKNARGFSFDFDFWSGEWPEFACSQFNDQFVPYLVAKGFNGGAGGNIAVDSSGLSISTGNAFLDRCTPGINLTCAATGATGSTSTCAGGEIELAGTGFDDPGAWCNGQTSIGGGATGWLTTSAPVQPGEVITLELVIWDVSDPSYDSSVTIDNFQWSKDATTNATRRTH